MTEIFAKVSAEAIEESAVREAVEAPSSGAVVLFSGVIRNHDAGESVQYLDYSAHPEAENILRSIVAEESSRTGLKLAAWHRVGTLQIGDVALVAAAASAHRFESFEAIQALIERIKHEVPIWKKQHYESGSSDWVGL